MCDNVPTEGITEAREVTVAHFGLIIVTETQSGRIYDFFFFFEDYKTTIKLSFRGSYEGPLKSVMLQAR